MSECSAWRIAGSILLPAPSGKARSMSSSPTAKMEINKVHLSVMRIINEYRNNRITVDFIPKEGAENDKLADTCDGLYRSDEEFSSADEAYDNAFEEAVGGGIGA